MSIFDITPEPLEGETPYFHGGEKPGQPGVFKRIYYLADGWSRPSFCKWDGERWYGGAAEVSKAEDEPLQPSHYQPFLRDGFDFAWCGLMPKEEAEAPAAETPAAEDSVEEFFGD